MSRVFALLVGINDYPASVGKLQGCLNDVDNVEAYLRESIPDPAIMVLKDQDATYAEVIRQFRRHLGRAGKDDVALFHYCGHGARATASVELRKFDRDHRDEGLVCVDSRIGDNFDLADKELGWLLSELTANEPHIAMILDCCHSGSGTRALDDGPMVGVRATASTYPPRPLASYLEGQFEQMRQRGEEPAVPASRHLLMAACDRSQTAKEDLGTHRGIFTTALFDVLRKSGDAPNYAELHVRAQAAVRQYIRETQKTAQDPQFEGFGGFDAYAGFLGRAARRSRPTYSVYYANDGWTVECGAIQGASTDPAHPAAFALSADDAPGGHAKTSRVGAQTSRIVPDFVADPQRRYVAELVSLPPMPMLVGFTGDAAVRAVLDAAIAADPAVGVALVDPSVGDGIALRAEGGSIRVERSSGGAIAEVPMVGDAWTAPVLKILAHIAQWRRTLALDNAHPRIDREAVDLRFVEQAPGVPDRIHDGGDFTLDYREVDGAWRPVSGEMQIRNRTGQVLNFALVHFGEDFAVRVLANDQVAPGDEYMTMLVGVEKPSPKVSFTVDAGDLSIERIKLIVSTERVDDFRIALEPIAATRGFGSAAEVAEAAVPITDDWFARDLTVRVLRRRDRIGAAALSLADGIITIEPHPSITADAAIASVADATRATGSDAAVLRSFDQAEVTLAGLTGSRGERCDALELSGIDNPAALATDPIRIRIDAPLAPGEAILPVVHDGRHVMLAGDSWRDDDGTTRIEITQLPGGVVDQRSLGGALKMYFLKTYLGVADVNRLRCAEFMADGRIEYRPDDVARHVAAARNVLLVVHGIIGDTRAILAGVRAAGLDTRFDLVLSYDYENLSTPIDQTAKAMGEAMAAVGLAADDDRRLTILAHSMGGLVSRCFVEREGGDAVVDHLVMCGTPNRGSPFGRVDTARSVLMMLATLGANFAPQVCGPALALLARSKKLTPTLEQMSPDSPFLAALNADPPPSVRYTILAGDIDSYRGVGGASFAELLVKAGRSTAFDTLFADRANDIAVGVDSIAGPFAAASSPVACYHLNYFDSPAGIAALAAVDWAR